MGDLRFVICDLPMRRGSGKIVMDHRTAGNRKSQFNQSQMGLGGRLMVGQVPLEHFVQVRILAAQPRSGVRGRDRWSVRI